MDAVVDITSVQAAAEKMRENVVTEGRRAQIETLGQHEIFVDNQGAPCWGPNWWFGPPLSRTERFALLRDAAGARKSSGLI